MYDQYIDFLRSTYLVHKNNGQIWTLVDRAAEKDICRNYTIWTVMDKGGGRQEGFPDNEKHQGVKCRIFKGFRTPCCTTYNKCKTNR